MPSDLDQFYKRYCSYVDVVAGYCNDRRIPFVFQACRLRPAVSLSESLPVMPQLERWWVDEFGSSVRLGRYKRFEIRINDIVIDRRKLTCTDIFANVETSQLSRMSKMLYWAVGLFGNKKAYVVGFLGRDNYLRTRIFINNLWISVSSLYLGIDILLSIQDNLEERSSLIFGQHTLPITNDTQYCMKWPPNREQFNMISEEEPILFNQLKMYNPTI